MQLIKVLHSSRRRREWSFLRAILSLSHKYGADAIMHEAKLQLNSVFPTDINSWDNRSDRGDQMRTIYTPSKDCISAANLGRKLELTHIRVIALYDCCQLSGEMLVSGTGDGEVLAPEDLARCFDAIPWLITARSNVRRDIRPYIFSKICTNYLCGSSADKLLEYLAQEPLQGDVKTCQAHLGLTRATLAPTTCWESHAKRLGICSHCTTLLMQWMQRQRAQWLQKDLPVVFKLT